MTTKTKSPAKPAAPKVPRKKPTGPKAASGPTAARVEFLRSEALRMRRTGMSCPEIGVALGVSRVRAWQLVTEAMADLRAETLQEAADWRLDLTEAHRENLKRALQLRDNKDADIAAKGLTQATNILKEVADLWGAKAPTKIAATTPDGTQPAAAFAVPVALAIADWAAQAQLVLAQGEEAAAQLAEEPANAGSTDDQSAG